MFVLCACMPGALICVNSAQYKGAISKLIEELFCSSDGMLFQRIIEHGRKLETDEDFFNKRDGVRFFSKLMSTVTRW